MSRLYPIPGTKQRSRGRQCLTFTFANSTAVIVDCVHPADRDAMFDRLWARYGLRNVWVSYRRMTRDEQYVDLADTDVA